VGAIHFVSVSCVGQQVVKHVVNLMQQTLKGTYTKRVKKNCKQAPD